MNRALCVSQTYFRIRLALKKTGFSPEKNTSPPKKITFFLCNFSGQTLQSFQIFFFFLSRKSWKNHSKKLLIIGPNFFFQYLQPAQIQPKSQFLFHKNPPPRDFSIMTLPSPLLKSRQKLQYKLTRPVKIQTHHYDLNFQILDKNYKAFFYFSFTPY